MTDTTTSSGSREPGLFETPFSIGATVLSALSALVAVLFFWTGFQGSTLPVVGLELSILTGTVGSLFALLVAVVALVAAFYMELGFDY
ncbi:hypothetical protein [Natrialba asiatica]|nr:hypothetical protein [Natrialba asiatica]